MKSSLHYQVISVNLAGASISGPSLSHDMGDDWDRSYGIYVDIKPVTAFQRCACEGDIYVRASPDAQDRSIHIRTEGQWIGWYPNNIVSVDLVGLIAYAAPCVAGGFRYVATLEQASQVPPEVPRDIPTLAELVANDIRPIPRRPRGSNIVRSHLGGM